MGNTNKTQTNTEAPTNTTPLSACILNPLDPVLDEIAASRKKWQEEKAEQDKKDAIYKNVDLTKEFLQQNIDKESYYEINGPATSFLTKDIYGFDILKINLSDFAFKRHKYISSVNVSIVSKHAGNDSDDETIHTLLQNSKYNLSLDIYNLIFYGDFVPNQNLLLSNKLSNYIVLPQFITKAYANIDINILNIKKLLPILDKLEISILVTEVDFNEFAEGRINYKYYFEQNYEKNDETWNKLNIDNGSGCTCVAYAMNMSTKKLDDIPE